MYDSATELSIFYTKISITTKGLGVQYPWIPPKYATDLTTLNALIVTHETCVVCRVFGIRECVNPSEVYLFLL